MVTFIINFMHNPAGTLMSLGVDVINAIADAFQRIIDLVLIPENHSVLDMGLHYSKEEILNDTALNQYVNITEYEKNGGGDWQRKITIKKEPRKEENNSSSSSDEDEEEKDYRFDGETTIPIALGDMHNAISGRISFLDANFLTGAQNHVDDGLPIWTILRNIAATLVHIAIYVSGVLLLVFLIVFSLQIVKNSFDNPEEEELYKEKLERFVDAVARLVGSILIMSIGIFGSNALINTIEFRQSVELPIRVNVEPAGYSFSTNPTGYLRYMAKNADVDQWQDKAFYATLYIACVVLNWLFIIVLVLRVIGMWALSVIGPISALFTSFDTGNIMRFDTWAKTYLFISVIPVALALVDKFLINNI